ncbi:16S rRNA (adenine(1518)-N(6)/adenine(1519)-N(6))-dimethyltransferase RsmA [Candidatus Nardonella dryophthoridicola]|uniref:16S rRNA (adenine(1518)-N(6)/adenine(1519)-N(6))- dimethyltransferase RsmA n=1 Tax=Candidatus Nardonella dryophthoridicola TaxID=1971485 RepID=UPI001AD87952|nr:16S rRNA (adenine(1518)-N(6)/adenine(1519)-N(6))-dimethyltransferase RsmA [Candidatus Nardonella dryophthoridicola]QTJ62964.1 ribosomal RNA small subunit methyltransferase A [Candidatus Nardonella dryophthoridicola]
MLIKKKKPIFDQYILKNNNIIKEIIKLVNISFNDNILEIGPGTGSLTNEILKYNNKISIVEIDKNILPIKFFNNKNINLFIENAIYFNISKIYNIKKKKVRIIGNLPYKVSIPIIINLIKYRFYIEDINIMIQQELSDKLLLLKNKYCRISFLLSLFFNIKLLIKNINPNNFYPIPKVKSSFINIKPYFNSINNNIDINKIKNISIILFNNKRKKIKNSLKKYIFLEKLDKKILNNRLEKLSLYEIYNLSNYIKL